MESSEDRRAMEEAEAAAAEAGEIGGEGTEDAADPAERPRIEAGGGVSEGFELAEADLRENAEHGGGEGDPVADRFEAEEQSDRSTAEYGEADGVDPELRQPGSEPEE